MISVLFAACGNQTADDDTPSDSAAPDTTASSETTAGPTETTAGDSVTPDDRGTTLTYSYPQEPPNWNYWETGLTAVTAPLLINVLETLVQLEADGSPVPLLAESWEVSDDGMTVTLAIRQGVVFHDGSDLTSADVVYSLNKNAESTVSRASGAFVSVTDISAVDDYTLEITLSAPSQSFLPRLADRAGIIVPENFFEDNDAATTVIGTGPYTFGEYRIDQDLTLHRFADYWGDQPYFETVVQRFIPDETAAINALLAGEIDMVASVIGEGMDRVASLADEEGLTVELIPGTEVSYWALNTNVEAFQDIRIRQAIQYGHNRQSHIDAATAGTATSSCSMAVPAGVPWDTDYCPYPYDPDKARSLLEEAGATDLTFRFPFANVAWHTVMAQIFQAEMADIGINIELESQDLATWLDQTNTQGQFEIFQITSGAALSDYRCGSGRQPFGNEDQAAFCDETMDEMIDNLDSILDYDEYVEAQKELHNYVADQGWIFATKKPNTPVVYRSDLVGLKRHRLPDIHIDLRGLRWDG
ncbi:MAG TPA: ABC transporter substrate-binding protein [Acidimicrobiia bacterium]|nr:ABC transporter substrate-binding protein [Acidimicrobiia bacterium]